MKTRNEGPGVGTRTSETRARRETPAQIAGGGRLFRSDEKRSRRSSKGAERGARKAKKEVQRSNRHDIKTWPKQIKGRQTCQGGG